MTSDPMTCSEAADQLGAYLEGDLPATARDAVEQHLATCPTCTALVADLERLAADAAALPPLPVDRDLWAGISRRIEAPTTALDGQRGRRAPRPVSRPAWHLAAAAAALAAVTAGVTHQLTLGTVRAPTTVAGAPVAARPAATLVARPDDADGQAVYGREITDLRAVLDRRRAELDPATVELLERNLELIDAAIAQSRAALAADPRSPFLDHRLSRALGTKVQLLRAAATLPARS